MNASTADFRLYDYLGLPNDIDLTNNIQKIAKKYGPPRDMRKEDESILYVDEDELFAGLSPKLQFELRKLSLEARKILSWNLNAGKISNLSLNASGDPIFVNSLGVVELVTMP